jgi:hypothetical protein
LGWLDPVLSNITVIKDIAGYQFILWSQLLLKIGWFFLAAVGISNHKLFCRDALF